MKVFRKRMKKMSQSRVREMSKLKHKQTKMGVEIVKIQSTKCLGQKSKLTNTSMITMQWSNRAIQTVKTIQGSTVVITV